MKKIHPSVYEDALKFHEQAPPGKLAVHSSKPLETQYDLSLAYSPGVAAPCERIRENPADAYKYTNKSNCVAVISNGTAVLGLGDVGALASKPVMEGKAVLFKRFANIDGVDIELDTRSDEEFIRCVKALAPSFGAINLEDIRAPSCFVIEEALIKALDIPVFHDDQHGTAIIVGAALLNALQLVDRKISQVRIIINGAGAAGIACADLLVQLGAKNIIFCDKAGVIYKGRKEEMDKWKERYAVDTDARTLRDIIEGAHVFIGLSVGKVLSAELVRTMADKPVIFALANPEPEILPEEALEAKPDALVATGRSDYPNQVNNAICFPYIFRGALDCQASEITPNMMLAAAHTLANLARTPVPMEVCQAYRVQYLKYGRQYFIPKPFDPRLGTVVPAAVAEAAQKDQVAGKKLDKKLYMGQLRENMNAGLSVIQGAMESDSTRKVIFAEGEEENVLRGALAFYQQKLGTPILIGKERMVLSQASKIGMDMRLFKEGHIQIENARKLLKQLPRYYDFLYERLARRGMLYRDCVRLVNRNRNVFAACLVKFGFADAMITGLSAKFTPCYRDVRKVLDRHSSDEGRAIPFCAQLFFPKNKTMFLADVALNVNPSAQDMASIAFQGAQLSRDLGIEPRIAFLHFENFNFNKRDPYLQKIGEAMDILKESNPDFEYDGPLTADVALDYKLMRDKFPCCTLTSEANFLIAPDLRSSHIANKLLSSLSDIYSIGPMISGLEKPCQIVPIGTSPNLICYLAALSTVFTY